MNELTLTSSFWRTAMRWSAAVLAAALLSCASLPDDPAGGVRQHLPAEFRPSGAAADESIADVLAVPLGAPETIRIALMRNPGLRAEYARLGIAAADVYDAGRLSNPKLHVRALAAGGASETSIGLTQAFTDLLLLSARRRLAEGEYLRLQLIVAHRTMRLAATAEEAYYAHVGALHGLRMRKQAAEAAALSAELAKRFFDAGNIGELQLAREQAAASEAVLKRLEGEAEVASTRHHLAQVMGLTPAQSWRLKAKLPTLAESEPELDKLLELAFTARLDLRAADEHLRLLADHRDVTRRTRLLGHAELGVEAEAASGESVLVGPTFSLELPLFNQGKGRVARREAALVAARAGWLELRARIHNSVALHHTRLLNHRAAVQEYTKVLLPARRAIVERLQEHVNFMLRGQFELLSAKKEEFEAMEGHIAAVRSYWTTRAELAREVGAPLPPGSPAAHDPKPNPRSKVTPDEPARPEAGKPDKSGQMKHNH